jgi:hypothetical protein
MAASAGGVAAGAGAAGAGVGRAALGAPRPAETEPQHAPKIASPAKIGMLLYMIFVMVYQSLTLRKV